MGSTSAESKTSHSDQDSAPDEKYNQWTLSILDSIAVSVFVDWLGFSNTEYRIRDRRKSKLQSDDETSRLV